MHPFGAQIINMTFNTAFQRKMFRLIQKLNILSPVFITAFYVHKVHNYFLCMSTHTKKKNQNKRMCACISTSVYIYVFFNIFTNVLDAEIGCTLSLPMILN